MNLLELQEKSLELRNQLAELIANGQKEERELNETETSQMAEIRSQIDEINAQIAEIENENRKLNKVEIKNNKIEKEIRTMSLLKMINTVVEGRNFTEDEAAAMAEARADFAKSGISPKGQIVYRSIAATVAGAGQENVAEDKWNLEVAVRNNLVATKMGADYVGGLVSDVSVPQYSGSNVLWKGETATADDGQGAFTEVTLTPKRLTATVDISRQFLLQDSNDAEALLIRDLAAAVAEKLDKTIFGTETLENAPAGLFAGVTATKAIAEMDYDDVLALEEAVELANGSNYMFIVNPKVKFALKGTQMANGLQMVYAGGEIDGFKTISSNSVADKGIICMDPKELIIGQWGSAFDIVVDPYTKAADGQVRLVINAYYDAKLRGNKVAKAIFN